MHEAASALELTPEHVRLYCEIASTGPPPATANGLPVSSSRADVLSPARLRDLYEHQNLPMTEIAALAPGHGLRSRSPCPGEPQPGVVPVTLGIAANQEDRAGEEG